MKLHIALLLPSLEGGGVQRALINLATGLKQNGLSVDLVVGKAAGPFKELVPAEVRIIELGGSGMLARLPMLIRYLQKERPDCLMSAQYHVNLTAILARWLAGTKTPLVISEHNDIQSVYKNAQSLKEHLSTRLTPHLYPFADRIVAVSQGVATSLSNWTKIPASRITVIYNPLVYNGLLDSARKPANHPWLEPGQLPVILSVGRLEPQKDFATLLKAFGLVTKKTPVRLLILGEGSQRPQIERQAREMKLAESVQMPGYAANPYAFMSRAAVFVLTSAWEGFPSVLVEAMACGCPLVSTNCPSGPNEILEAGCWGRLVPVGQVDALANAILETLNSPKIPGLSEAAGRFSIDDATKNYLALFSEICSR